MDNSLISGNVHKFGDDINTDVISPTKYLAGSEKNMAAHVMEGVRPGFSETVKPGDVIVAGKNFGSGSSRETAARALKDCGISAIIAPSFARIFYRNSINIGLPVLICDKCDELEEGNLVEVFPFQGLIKDLTGNKLYECEKIPENIMYILKHGGLLEDLAMKLEIAE